MQVGQAEVPGPSRRRHSERRVGGLREYVVTEKLSSDLKTAREDYGAHLPEYSRFIGKETTDSQGAYAKQPAQTPPAPSDRLVVPEAAAARPRKMESHSAPPKPSTLQKKILTQRRKGSSVREELKRTISAPMALEPAEVSIKPAFDAPVSAVNAGERRVRVKVDQTVLSVSVTPSTTPLDIIREAGMQLQMTIDPNTNVLLESFKQLGLERPLRRYEHIRDVMNSWDTDSQNSLNIVPSPTGGRDEDLDLKSVLQSQPGDKLVQIYHSNKPDTWDKKWITLRSDGQVLMAKKDGRTSNICHASDFDIYIPTKRQLIKKIKPPKQYCFAVKSQQKSSMFLTTENFVHFFTTGDRELAMSWYKAVQQWRSWYLVNVMGVGQNETAASGMQQQQILNSYSSPEKRNQGRPSFDNEPHPQYGFARPQPTSQASPLQRLPTRSHGPPPVSLPKNLTRDGKTGASTTRTNHGPSIIQQPSLVQLEPEPFASTGLLGRAYTQRQKARRDQDREKTQGGISGYRADNSAPNGGGGLQRTSSQRPEQKPLLDLTPQYQESPQHQKKDRGSIPEQIPTTGLVEAATNREPIATDPLEVGAGAGVKRSRTVRSQHPSNRHASVSPEKTGAAFTGGLLSSAQKNGQVGTGTGRGVKTGDRTATEPLLDLAAEGPWMPGSLLDRVNSGDSGNGPVIDREKRREVKAPVGEGL